MSIRTNPETSHTVRLTGVTDSLNELAGQRLRRIAQRYTAGRRAIVEVLAASDRPLTIPEIVDRGEGLALSSVYRNLATLEQAGIAVRIVTARDHIGIFVTTAGESSSDGDDVSGGGDAGAWGRATAGGGATAAFARDRFSSSISAMYLSISVRCSGDRSLALRRYSWKLLIALSGSFRP